MNFSLNHSYLLIYPNKLYIASLHIDISSYLHKKKHGRLIIKLNFKNRGDLSQRTL